jgi:mannose-1-phosphate guanylyltransferase
VERGPVERERTPKKILALKKKHRFLKEKAERLLERQFE